MSTLKPVPLPPPRPVWLPALVATLLVVVAGMTAAHVYVGRQIARHPQRFNVYPLPDKLLGLVLQRQAFTDPALLPVYGSSELSQPQTNRADDFFRAQPAGFGAFLIGNPGETCLMIATKIAAADPQAVRGRKAVVFLSPGWFVAPELDHPGFGVNFSPLHGGVFAFESAHLSPLLRQDLSRRLLDYHDILSKYPLLKAGLNCSAAGTTAQGALLSVITPLGAVHNRVQRELDYSRLGFWLWTTNPRVSPSTTVGVRRPGRIDWEAKIRDADAISRRQPTGTSYCVGPRTGFDDRQLAAFQDSKHPDRTPDENFTRLCAASKEWTDYHLLLRTAKELKIELLVICQPLNARFGDLQGISQVARNAFYGRLRSETAALDVPLLTYPAEGEEARHFQDAGHPTALMWLFYDKALDAFYHQQPTRKSSS